MKKLLILFIIAASYLYSYDYTYYDIYKSIPVRHPEDLLIFVSVILVILAIIIIGSFLGYIEYVKFPTPDNNYDFNGSSYSKRSISNYHFKRRIEGNRAGFLFLAIFFSIIFWLIFDNIFLYALNDFLTYTPPL